MVHGTNVWMEAFGPLLFLSRIAGCLLLFVFESVGLQVAGYRLQVAGECWILHTMMSAIPREGGNANKARSGRQAGTKTIVSKKKHLFLPLIPSRLPKWARWCNQW